MICVLLVDDEVMICFVFVVLLCLELDIEVIVECVDGE